MVILPGPDVDIPDTAPKNEGRTYSAYFGPSASAQFEDLLAQSMAAMGTTSRSDAMRVALIQGMHTILSPEPDVPAPTSPGWLDAQTVRNLATLGTLLVATKAMPQVAAALMPTVDSTIDAVSRDMDAISAFLDNN